MMLTSRKNQLWVLIILSAVTMAIPYAIQGALSAGKTPGEIHGYVWLADHIAWAIRAIVEGLVIAYISRTAASGWLQETILWALKLALIALIALTLGPTLYAALRNVSMREALPDWAQVAWAFGLASYMPLMVLGASYAYKVQPEDNGAQVERNEDASALQAEIAEWKAHVEAGREKQELMQAELARANARATAAQEDATRLRTDFAAMQESIATAQTIANQAQAWDILSASAKAEWIALHCNGDRPPAAQLAQALGVNISTVSRAYKKADESKGA